MELKRSPVVPWPLIFGYRWESAVVFLIQNIQAEQAPGANTVKAEFRIVFVRCGAHTSFELPYSRPREALAKRRTAQDILSNRKYFQCALWVFRLVVRLTCIDVVL